MEASCTSIQGVCELMGMISFVLGSRKVPMKFLHFLPGLHVCK